MARDIVTGQVANLPIGYSIKVEDSKLEVAAYADLAALVDVAEKALPEGSLKPIEVMALEMVKSALKTL